ncbi:NADP-dependent oxidoreductase [Gordonia zhaorongruii]|uniref:NADP-dependent oxidoreductase n=1 Tax=Gordonia zhaorongruii TaxID=2597659 RepID=UPI001052F3B9|nr:NADP-dependent oxidoreductase [Gordonia zhaorongruii]
MTMQALALGAFDQTPALTQVATPEPAPGEARVRVHAASVNGFDLSVGKGMLQGMMEHRFPVVLGKDFAGTVDAIGDGVEDYAVGDRVFGVVTKDFLGDGSFGEYVTVPVQVGIARLPGGVDFERGGALGLAGTAALNAFDAAGIEAGQTVLVVGATGGVGQQAVQLAARAGATVIATAHTEAEITVVTDLGAARTVDHTGDLSAQVREIAPDGVDAVLHFAGSPDPVAALVKPGGVFVSTMLRSPEEVQAEGVRVESIYAQPATETLERVAANEASGHTRVTVQQVFGLDDAPAAFERFAQGTLGKIVVRVA